MDLDEVRVFSVFVGHSLDVEYNHIVDGGHIDIIDVVKTKLFEYIFRLQARECAEPSLQLDLARRKTGHRWHHPDIFQLVFAWGNAIKILQF